MTKHSTANLIIVFLSGKQSVLVLQITLDFLPLRFICDRVLAKTKMTCRCRLFFVFFSKKLRHRYLKVSSGPLFFLSVLASNFVFMIQNNRIIRSLENNRALNFFYYKCLPVSGEILISHLTFTCSKSTIETLEKV